MTATNPGTGKQELTQLKPTELVTTVCTGEGRLTQTEPTKEKITQPKTRKVKSTQSATSEKPIQNEPGIENLCTKRTD